ncbi:DUF2269 family protein [Noviherbaspirillum saxi]|uniref:DUF2269 domain-containing protein n=1 Tax=Noviherbaspirillum saxi TaxID=2320863 RepID=A0A3A3FIF0_9BURK|nr:DUF2269 domain-containing protein [Noviherbaspirillum saxi]RJF95034.1 DUF2269 domain-containing protein [Noviherbaspirillum saxi]
MEYIILKWLHILSSTFLFGTGVGSAFYLLFATLTRDVRAIAVVSRIVVLADWLFTSTTIIIQPLTGYLLMRIAGFPMSARWIAWSVGLYVIAVACWIPVLWLQTRLKQLSREAADAGTPLPDAYWRYFRYWVLLGIPAFCAFLAIFYLMVAKPA